MNKNKIKLFWESKKDAIKNGIILVTVPALAVSIVALQANQKVIKDNNLEIYFYGEGESIEQTNEEEA